MNCFFPFNKKSGSRKGKSSQEVLIEKEQVKGKKSQSRKGKSSQEVLIEEEHVKRKKSESRKGKSSQKVLIEKEQVKGKGKSSQEVLIEDEHVKGNKSESWKGESSQEVLMLIEKEHVKGKKSESRKGESSHEVLIEKEHNLREFSFSELQTATENFNSSLIIGEDSYGRVFKGTITHPKGNGNLTVVAVQMLTGELGSMYWRAAFQFRGVVDHPNIVKLLGYCSEDGKKERHRLLVHEYMPNRSLRDHLSDKASTTLPWMTRLEIILGAAQTLAYLHEGLEIQVIYRDFKPSNVLLDEYFKPKLSELGFATESPTNKVVGTFGYMAPEYFLTGHITVKSDVYSFGVALYEILTGRQVHDIMPMEDQTLQEWVKLHLADSIDPRLENQYSLSAARQIAKLADTCLNKDPKNRPRMSQVVENLKQVMEESVEESFSEKGRSKSSASSKHSDQMEVIESSRKMEGFRIPDKQKLSAPDPKSIGEEDSERLQLQVDQYSEPTIDISDRWSTSGAAPEGGVSIVLNIGRYGTYRPVRLGIWRLRYRYVPYRIGRYTKKVKKFTTAAPDSRDVSPIRPDTDTPIPRPISRPIPLFKTMGVSSMEETVLFNEMGEVATKGQKLSPEDEKSLSEVTESFYEELREELFLEKLKETPSEPRVSEELNCDPVEVPPTISYHFSALHVLDLSYTEIKSLPQSISRLIALQKLFLRSCELLMELPPEIGELTNLEVLDLEGTEILCLPKEIAKLVNLKCLKVSFYGYANQTVIPRRALLKLSRLNELIIDVTPYGEWWDAEVEDITDDLFSLDELRTLKLYLPTAELLEGLTRIFSGLVNFRFTVGRHEEHFISRFPQNVEEEFNNWEKLKKGLKFINGNHIPNEITKVLKQANAFVLKRHWTAKSLSEFGHENMNEVKFCLVMECNELQTIVDCEQFYQGKDGRGESEDFKNFDEAIVLGSLEKLIIRYMKNMVTIWKGLVGKGSLSNLKSLALHTCPSLTALFTIDMLRNLINLEELIVEDCPKIESLVSLKSTSSNSGLFLRNLKKISLLELPELVNISSGLLIAPNLERMVIFYCPKLEKLSTTEVSSTELKVIKGEKEWWDALKWYESDLSTEHEDYLARLFIPLRRDGDLMAQLTED